MLAAHVPDNQAPTAQAPADQPPAAQVRPLAFAAPPWDRTHPDWLRLDPELDPNDDARLICRLVDKLDLTPPYSPSPRPGTAALPADPLLKVALYHFSQTLPSPKTWAKRCRKDDSAKWLAFGLRPSV